MKWLKARLRVVRMKLRHPVVGLLVAALIALPAMSFRAYQEWFSDHWLHHVNAALYGVTGILEFGLAVFVFLERRAAKECQRKNAPNRVSE